MSSIQKSEYQYFKCVDRGVVVKITTEAVVFTVQVVGFTDKSYIHHKQKTVFEKADLPRVLHKYSSWQKATYLDYLKKLKDYHGMERYQKEGAKMAWEAYKIHQTELGFEYL